MIQVHYKYLEMRRFIFLSFQAEYDQTTGGEKEKQHLVGCLFIIPGVQT
jgi:hypothetical protein